MEQINCSHSLQIFCVWDTGVYLSHFSKRPELGLLPKYPHPERREDDMWETPPTDPLLVNSQPPYQYVTLHRVTLFVILMQSYNHKITKLNLCKSCFGNYWSRLWGLFVLNLLMKGPISPTENEGNILLHFLLVYFEDVKVSVKNVSPKDFNLEEMGKQEKSVFIRC